MFCTTCGCKPEPNAKFCANCSAAVVISDEESMAIPLPSQTNTQKEVRIWKSVVVISVLALFLVGGAIVGMFFFFTSDLFNSEDEEYELYTTEAEIIEPKIYEPEICTAKYFYELLGKWEPVPGFEFIRTFRTFGAIEFLPDGTIIHPDRYSGNRVGEVSIPKEGEFLFTDEYGTTHEFTYTLIGSTLTIISEDNERAVYVRYMEDGPPIPIDFSHLVGEWRLLDGWALFFDGYEYIEIFDDGTIVAFNRRNNWSSTNEIIMLDKGIFRLNTVVGLIHRYTLNEDILTIYAGTGVMEYERVENAPSTALDHSHLVGIWMETPEIFYVFFDNADYIELTGIDINRIDRIEIHFGKLTMLDEGVFFVEDERDRSVLSYVLNGDDLIITNAYEDAFYLTRINSIPIDIDDFINPDEFSEDDFVFDERLVGRWEYIGGIMFCCARCRGFAPNFEAFDDGSFIWATGQTGFYRTIINQNILEINEEWEYSRLVIYNIWEESGSYYYLSMNQFGIALFKRVD